MTRRQLIAIYIFIIFMMTWGFDLINVIKFDKPIELTKAFSPFHLSQIIYAAITFYLTTLVLKKYYLTGKYLQLFFSLTATIALFIIIRYTLEQFIYPVAFNIWNYPETVTISYYILDNIYYAIIYITLGFLIFLLDNQVSNQKKQALLLQQHREAELQFLRTQINPHFLFNTLNNIYSLVYEKSEKAPYATLKLSEMMRYMLYEKKEMVPLQKEWEYIHTFIELQKLRFDHDLPLEIEFVGNMGDRLIPPYLLIPFVENMFKHGDTRDRAVPLKIRLTVTEKEIKFETSNKIKKQNKDESGGIGMENVKRRLELVFPSRHSLQTEITDSTFKTSLVLKM